jgi:hypothetical protein
VGGAKVTSLTVLESIVGMLLFEVFSDPFITLTFAKTLYAWQRI